MIFTFTKVQYSVKTTGMIDVIHFQGTFSVRKVAPERFPPLPIDSYATDSLVAAVEIST